MSRTFFFALCLFSLMVVSCFPTGVSAQSACPTNLALDPDGRPDLHSAGGANGFGSCLPPKDSIVVCPEWDNLHPTDLSRCRTITNNSKNAYFVPWNTKKEWDAFTTAAIDGVTVSLPGRVCQKGVYAFEICDETATVFERHGQKTMGTWKGTQSIGYGAEGETREYSFNGSGHEDPSGEYKVSYQCKQDWDSDGNEIMNWVKIADTGACTPAACTKLVDLNNLDWGVWVPNSPTIGYDKYLCDGGNLVSYADFKPGVAWLWHWKCHGTNDSVVDCHAKYGSWPMGNECGFSAWYWDDASDGWKSGTLAHPAEVSVGNNLEWYYAGNSGWYGDDSTNPPANVNTPWPGTGMGTLDAHRYLCDRGFVKNFHTEKDAMGNTKWWQWVCAGLNHGPDSPLCVAKPSDGHEDGKCGPADGTKSVEPPSSEDSMCVAGWGGDTAHPVTDAKGNVLKWTWNCWGKNTGDTDADCSAEHVLACSDPVAPYVKDIAAGPILIKVEVVGKGFCDAFVSASFKSVSGQMTSYSSGSVSYAGAKYKFALPISFPSLASIITETQKPFHASPCYVGPLYVQSAVVYTVQGKAGACPYDTKLNAGSSFTIP